MRWVCDGSSECCCFSPRFVTNLFNANTASHTLNSLLQLNTDPLSLVWKNNIVIAVLCVCTAKERCACSSCWQSSGNSVCRGHSHIGDTSSDISTSRPSVQALQELEHVLLCLHCCVSWAVTPPRFLSAYCTTKCKYNESKKGAGQSLNSP